MYLIPHDGTKEGDSSFWAPTNCKIDHLPDTLEEAKEIWKRYLLKDGWSSEEIPDYLSQIKGIWIVDQDAINLMHAVCIAIAPQSDRESYSCNRACKGIASYLCKHSFGMAL